MSKGIYARRFADSTVVMVAALQMPAGGGDASAARLVGRLAMHDEPHCTSLLRVTLLFLHVGAIVQRALFPSRRFLLEAAGREHHSEGT